MQTIEWLVQQTLVGITCSEVTARGNYLEVRFGDRLLIVYAAWRIAEGDAVLVGSGAEEQQLDRVIPLLLGQIVSEVQLIGAFHDLRLAFVGGRRFESFADEGAFEQWNLVRSGDSGSPQRMVIAGPGDRVAVL